MFFTRRTLSQALRRAGFRIEREAVSTVPLPLALPRLPDPAARALAGALGVPTRLFPNLLGYQLLAAARRL